MESDIKIKYGVKILYTYSVNNGEKIFHELSVLSVNADSFDEAYEKAEKYASETCETYLNVNEQTVEMSFEALDCFLAYEEDDVFEIYSGFMKNSTSLSDGEYLDAVTQTCTAEEIYELRHR